MGVELLSSPGLLGLLGLPGLPIAALLGLVLAGGSPASTSSCGPTSVRLGPAAAERRVELWIDPIAEGAWSTWLSLAQIVGERDPELTALVHLAVDPEPRHPGAARVRAIAVAAARTGRLPALLARIDREGWIRLLGRLRDGAGRRALAADLGMTVAELERALLDRCGLQSPHEATRVLESRRSRGVGWPLRLPASRAGDSHPITTQPDLPDVRAYAVDPAGRDVGGAAPAIVRRTEPRRDSTRLPAADRGMTLGGPGLSHHLVIGAVSEDEPTLHMTLQTVLPQRTYRPGTLSVQIVARGDSMLAARMRARLCAATRLGLELPYARWLAAPPHARDPATHDDGALLRELDTAAEVPRCRAAPGDEELELPDGIWLDGAPRLRGDLDALVEITAPGAIDPTPLSPWLRAKAFDR